MMNFILKATTTLDEFDLLALSDNSYVLTVTTVMLVLSDHTYSCLSQPLNMILDDGGDLTRYVLDTHPELCAGIKGVSEV